eukprot:1728-Heterococcus_DN1.PRE.1
MNEPVRTALAYSNAAYPKPSRYTTTTTAQAAVKTASETRSKGQWERWAERICTTTNSNAVASAMELATSAAFLPTLQALLKLAAKPDASEQTQATVRRALHVAGTALLILSNEGAASDDKHHSEHLLDTIESVLSSIVSMLSELCFQITAYLTHGSSSEAATSNTNRSSICMMTDAFQFVKIVISLCDQGYLTSTLRMNLLYEQLNLLACISCAFALQSTLEVLQQHSNSIKTNNANATTAGSSDDACLSGADSGDRHSLLAMMKANILALQSLQRDAHVTDDNSDRKSMNSNRIAQVLSIIQESVVGGDKVVSRTDSSLNHQHKEQVLLVYTSLKILSVLTAISKHFTVQLIEAHSVIALITSNVLNSSIYPDASVLATALTIIGQLARHSNDSELLSSTFQHDVLQCNTLGSDLCILLQHAEGAVRSKCCSLIGNLCKAGDWWLLS